MKEQLLIPNKTFHTHHNSPALLACYDAMWEFEELVGYHFVYQDEYELQDILEETRIDIGVSNQLNDAKRDQLELWELRYKAANQLIKNGKGHWFCAMKEIKEMTP